MALVLVAGVGCAFAEASLKTPVVSGDGYHLRDGASDWTAAASYYENAVPKEGDVVIVPSSVTVTLNASTDADSLALANSLKNIWLTGDDSRLEITVEGSDVKEITRSITAYNFSGKTVSGFLDYTGGPIVKKGTGTLILSSFGFQRQGNARNYDYYSQIVVSEGVLKLTPDLSSTCYLSNLGRIQVEENATLFLPRCTWSNSGVYLNGLSGNGIVTNELSGSYVLDLYFEGKAERGDTSDFAGRLNGKYNSLRFVNDAQILSGVNSYAVCGSIQSESGSHVKLASLGISSASPSSVGYGTPTWWVSEAGATIGFVGLGGLTCGQGLAFKSTADSSSRMAAVVDAGDEGNLAFTGLWQRQYSSEGGKLLVLTGDNAKPCVLAGHVYDQFDSPHEKGRGHSMYISKEGSGTWRFDKTARTAFASGISVNEGVLEYETIARQGVACSIGVATNLTDGQWGAADTNAEHRVDYALRLGAPTLDGASKTSGRLSYVGTAAGSNPDRKVALAGAGGFRSDAASGGIAHGDVYGISTQPMSLYLDGDNATDGNVVNRVSDGTAGGKVTVVKEGTGKWHVGGSSAFTGGIEVNGGELVLDSLRYAWYRWTVTDLYPVNAEAPYSGWVTGSTTKEFTFYEFGLYDKDGYNQAEHYQMSKTVTSEADIPSMEPGTAQMLAYGGNRLESILQTATEGGVASNYYMDVWKAFDLKSTSGYGVWGVKYKLFNAAGTQIRIDGSDPDTRVSMVVRVKPGVKDIVGYDHMNTYGGWNKDWNTAIRNAHLDGSVDGIHWDRLHTAIDAPVHYDGNMWSYQGGYSDGESGHTLAKAYAKSFQLVNPHDIARCPKIAAATGAGVFPVHSVKLSGGGKLTVAGGADALTVTKLTVDATTGGTLDGATLASNLTIDFTNVPVDQQKIEIPVTFANVRGLENSAGWIVSSGDKVKGSWSVSVKDGKLYLIKGGMSIIIR